MAQQPQLVQSLQMLVSYKPLARDLALGQPNALHGTRAREIGVARIAAIDEASMPHQRAEI